MTLIMNWRLGLVLMALVGIFLAVTLVTLGRVMSERPHLSASA